MDCYSISLNGFFFMIFSKIVFANFIGENSVVFLTKHCQLLQRFSSWFFSFQNYLCRFFFNIKLVENLALQFCFFLLTGQLNQVGKALYLFSQNTVDCYKSFCSVSKFLITNTTFFSVMKY